MNDATDRVVVRDVLLLDVHSIEEADAIKHARQERAPWTILHPFQKLFRSQLLELRSVSERWLRQLELALVDNDAHTFIDPADPIGLNRAVFHHHRHPQASLFGFRNTSARGRVDRS